MFDILSEHFAPETIRCAAVWICFVSAVFIGPVLAFSVTDGAGIRCPLALLRLLQRVALCALSIALAYLAAWIVQTGYVPNGPEVFVLMSLFFVVMLSGIRHALALPIPRENSGRLVFHKLRESDSPRKVSGVR